MKRNLLALVLLLLFAGSALAQDATREPVATQEPTAAATLEATTPAPAATPVYIQIPPSQEVAIAGVNAFYAFIGGLAVGGLGFGGIILLGVTVILRSPVLLTAVEGLVYSRLDSDGIKNLRTVGTVLDKAGELIDKVTDGKPNESQTVTVTATTTGAAG